MRSTSDAQHTLHAPWVLIGRLTLQKQLMAVNRHQAVRPLLEWLSGDMKPAADTAQVQAESDWFCCLIGPGHWFPRSAQLAQKLAFLQVTLFFDRPDLDHAAHLDCTAVSILHLQSTGSATFWKPVAKAA